MKSGENGKRAQRRSYSPLGKINRGARRTPLNCVALTMIASLQRDIVDRLGDRSEYEAVVRQLKRCQIGACRRCADVCAVKGHRWKNANLPAIVALFDSSDGARVLDVRVRRHEWAGRRGHLGGVSLIGIEKGARRALDALRSPATVAVGQMDAWWNTCQWEVGIRFLIVGSSEQELRETFAKFAIEIREVSNVKMVLQEQWETIHFPKRLLSLEVANDLPNRKRRAEFYRWLCTLDAGSRVFRYGCNRYFQKLKKELRPVLLAKPTKKRSLPRCLERFQYGNHPPNCQCIPCGGPGLRYNQSSQSKASKAKLKRYFDDL